jgi:hypothetical protein
VIARAVYAADLDHQRACFCNGIFPTEAVILSHKHRNDFTAVSAKFHSEGRIAAAFLFYLRFYDVHDNPPVAHQVNESAPGLFRRDAANEAGGISVINEEVAGPPHGDGSAIGPRN